MLRCSVILRKAGSSKRTSLYRQASTQSTNAKPTVKATTVKRTYKKKEKTSLDTFDLTTGQLPPRLTWHFPRRGDGLNAKGREIVSISNPDTADLVANASVPEGSKGKVIIEGFPGPGCLTRALLKLPKERIRKIIILEDNEEFLRCLRPLAKLDPRVHIVEESTFHWTSLDKVESLGLLDDVDKPPYAEVHPVLQFVSHLPLSVYGEQLISQYLRCIPPHAWLFRYGRIPMDFIMTEWVWKRLNATGDTSDMKARSKLAVMAEATAEFSQLLPPESMAPYGDHFWPNEHLSPGSIQSRHMGQPMTAVRILPWAEQIIAPDQLDNWDFCVRRLFAIKGTPLSLALKTLCPGAENLLPVINNPAMPDNKRIDVSKLVRLMTLQDWAVLVDAFDKWPFAPKDLLFGDGLMSKVKKETSMGKNS